ncbi:hypothetical protein N8I77_008687 [Diaporthe amygdali]|uniref:Uncharacterized protein n=1 Tax=Phomopsis amygdali TaxID=1214568 RepID=A0AAD9S8I7_PHOAM|nr:hypothetical protein N8I77_008687 [Diaporthe amygdali]
MNSNTDYWYSAPEVVHAVKDHFPEPVHVSAAGTEYMKTGQWPHVPESHYPGAQNTEEHHPEEHYAEENHPEEPHPEAGPQKEGTRKRICGLASRTFWVVLSVTAVAIVGAAVGIGIGVSIANRSRSTESLSSSSTSASASSISTASTSLVTTSPSSSTSDTPTTTSAQSTSVTTTSVVGPSATLYRDCPSSDETLYDITLGDKEYMFRKYCSTTMVATGDVLVSKYTADLNTCINQCAEYNYNNSTEIAAGANACAQDSFKWQREPEVKALACNGYPYTNNTNYAVSHGTAIFRKNHQVRRLREGLIQITFGNHTASKDQQ